MVWRGRAATPAVALRPGNVGLGPGAAASYNGPRARVGPGHAGAAPGPGTQTATVRWHQSGSRGIRVGRPPASVPHPGIGHATVAAPARPDRRAMVRSCRTRVRLRAAAGPPRLSRSRHSRGPVASRSGLQRSRSRRIPVGLVTAAVPAHPRPSPNGCGRRGQQGGLRAGKADGETKDDQTQVTQRRSLGH